MNRILTARADRDDLKPPATHRIFSRLEFVRGSGTGAELVGEHDPLPDDSSLEEDAGILENVLDPSQRVLDQKGWLEDDDIEDF